METNQSILFPSYDDFPEKREYIYVDDGGEREYLAVGDYLRG